jgi:hypothetical protein
VLRSQQGAPAAHILDALLASLREFCQSPALKDDVTAVVVVRTSE